MHVHAQWAEVAPLAPLVVDLGAIAALLFCIGCIYVLRAFLAALLNSLSHAVSIIPGIGGIASSAVHRAEQAISAALGDAESYFDGKLGLALHEAARLVDWTYREIKAHANLIYTLATLLLGQAAVGALRAGIATLHGNVHGVTARVTNLYARVLHLEHRLAHTVDTNVLPRLGRLEREYDRVIDKRIAGLHDQVKAAEDLATRTWDYVRAHPWTVVTDAFVGAVAVALARLDLGWIRCPSMGKLFGKWGCGIGSLLDDLLSIVVSALILENVCAVLPVLEDAFGGVVGPVTHILTEVPLGGCETPPKSWVQLHVAAGPLPPRQTLGALPT